MFNAIQELFRKQGSAYEQRFGKRMPDAHRKVIYAICNCGTGRYGNHVFECGTCGKMHSVDGSCGNRHCPTCQGGKSNEWLEKQLKKTLPVNYFMITFTIPEELRRLFRSNQKACYSALFKAAADSLKKLAKDPKYVGCDLAGFTGILHTWTRQLEYHPHIHFIVPGGGLKDDEWKESRADFFIHCKPLGIIFRAKLMEELKKAGLAPPASAWKKEWVIDSRHVGNGKSALKYLAQYVFRVAISPSRIVNVTDTHVTFQYQPSGKKNWRKCTLEIFEFIRRYLQHVLPSGFTKVRHFGFMAPNSRAPLQYIRELICILYECIVELLPKPKPKQKKPWICTCGGTIKWLTFVPRPRGVG
jgi:hypothetical protein